MEENTIGRVNVADGGAEGKSFFAGSRCRACNQPISFKPHPNNPAKMAPFDADGEIHFARCAKGGKVKREYKSAGEILCDTCEAAPALIFKKPTLGGDRLAIVCMGGHVRQIPMTEGNLRLVDGVADQAEYMRQYRDLVFWHSYGGQADQKSIRQKARALLWDYRDKFGVNDSIREFTGAVPGKSVWWHQP